ncbi:hypothetical protein BKA93DRAFT_770458 [Sparassis latifolia]
MSFVALPKTLPITLPDFSSLHEMSFSNGAVSDYAPLLTHLPNLEKLDSVGLNIHPPNVELIFQTPSPTFNLQHLRLCQCSLSPEESKWLLGSSRNIACAELLELGSDAFTTRRTVAVSFASVPWPIPVVKAICDTVRSLHIKGMLDASQQGDPRFVTEIRRFVRLKALKPSENVENLDPTVSNELVVSRMRSNHIESRGVRFTRISPRRQGVSL